MGSMGLTHAADPTQVIENRRRFVRLLHANPEWLTVVGAVHGSEVVRLDLPLTLVEGVDGIVTDRPGVALFAVFADCLPLIVHDPVNHALGLAHAGWRGTEAGIAGEKSHHLRVAYAAALAADAGREAGGVPGPRAVAGIPGTGA